MNNYLPLSDDQQLWDEREQMQHLAVGIILQAIDDAERLARTMTKNEVIHNRKQMNEIVEFFDQDLEAFLETFKLKVKIEPLQKKIKPFLDKIRNSLNQKNVIFLQQPVIEKDEIEKASGF